MIELRPLTQIMTQRTLRFGSDTLTYGSEEVHKGLAWENASFDRLKAALETPGFVDAECAELPSDLTRPEFEYDNWYVLKSYKPEGLND